MIFHAWPDRLLSRLNTRLGRKLRTLKWTLIIIGIVLIIFYNSRVSEIGPISRPKMKMHLWPKDFCPGANSSRSTLDDLTYWGSPHNLNGKHNVRILLISSSPGPSQAKEITEFLVMNRLKYKIAYSGKHLPDLISLSKGIGKYSVIIFQDMRDFYHMDQWNREILNKYCRQFSVGILGFLPTGNEILNYEGVDDNSSSYSLKISSHTSLSSISTGEHPMFRILKKNLTLTGYQLGAKWLRFESLVDGFDQIITGSFDDGVVAPIVIEDLGNIDGVKKVLIGGNKSMQYWFIKLLVLDALNYLSMGEISLPLTRYVLVDIDDIFVGVNRLQKSDVVALEQSQNELSEHISGFHYNLGFSGSYFHHGTEEENEADSYLIERKEKFWWFPHMWKHIQPHRFDNVSDLLYRMNLNKQFASTHSLPITHRYAVAPHHSGVYPIHDPLYQAWRSVWDISVTSTEEYPNLRPAKRRRGFQYKDVSVLPRQTCGLFTKNLFYEDYPGGTKKLEESISGGELFLTIVTNPISIFMTHMPNYCCDRLAPYAFQSVASMINCHTNLNLKTVPPHELSSTYFKLFPEEVQALWGNPCDDKRHLEIWSESKKCNKLPSFLVIGPQKTGTTALYSFLKLHPNIVSNFPSKETFEEVQFFKGTNYAKGLDWYMDHFPEGNSTHHVFEKSATYFDGEMVPIRAHRLLPKANIIAVLIHPGQRAYSWYQHMKAHSDPTALRYTFKEVITATSDSPRALLSLQSRCLEPGKYAQHLDKWLAQYRPRQIHIVDGEEVKRNPVEVMNQLQHYLQISPFFDYKNSLVFDKNKGFFCMLIEGKKKCLGKGKGRKYPPMDEFCNDWLNKFYKKSNENLLKLLTKLGYSIPKWLIEESNNDA